jgi:hypothetical protein
LTQSRAESSPNFWLELAEIGRRVPKSQRLPADASERFDDYFDAPFKASR